MKRGGPIKPSKILPRKVYPTRSRPQMTPERKAAKNQPCLLNVANVCNYNTETVSLAHFRWLGECGTGKKPPDSQGCPACSECNRWSDSPTPREVEDCGGRVAYERDRNFYAARALARMRLLDRQAA